MAVAAFLREADLATAEGNLGAAIVLLRQAVSEDDADQSTWLKLAAIERASGHVIEALAATDRAIALAPLDFIALLMRATLLERLGDPRTAEAFDNALARTPSEALSPQVAQIVAHGRECVGAWRAQREAELGAVSGACDLDQDARARLDRFASNIVRRTRVWHSEPTNYHFPELAEREFHPRRLFWWLPELEAATEAIASEFVAVMAAERHELVPYIQYPDTVPLRQWQALNHSLDWTAIHLLRNGVPVDANLRHCPKTQAILARVGQPRVAGASPNAMFSLLAPHAVIPPHVGIDNSRLVCHLPLIIPPGCWFRVGATTRSWEPGEAFVFDDTIEHEATNPSDQLRVVFIFDVWHPDLTPGEQEAVAAMITHDAKRPV